MDEQKAKELIEKGMENSIKFGEMIHSASLALADEGIITPLELSAISNCLLGFEGHKLAVFLSRIHDRGSKFEDMRDDVCMEFSGSGRLLIGSRIAQLEEEDTLFHFEATPNHAIESLLECTLPEAVERIAHMDIPPDCSHILKVLGWQRHEWNIEKLEAGLVTEARRRIRKQRKGKKK
jgi:hypothetical protein